MTVYKLSDCKCKKCNKNEFIMLLTFHPDIQPLICYNCGTVYED